MSTQRSQTVLYTFGYEGLDQQDFLEELKKNEIQYVIDIREKPISRKKGFSKSALNEILSSTDISYMHYRDLGSPGDLRKKLREDGDHSYFFQKFSKYLSSKQDILEAVHETTKNFICCLICFEKDHEKCHRKIVAKEIKRINKNGMLLKHL